MTKAETMQRLADTESIRSVLTRYFRVIDRFDFEGIRACFAPDVRAEYAGHDVAGGVDGLIRLIADGQGEYESAFHPLCDVAVEVTGDAATAESYAFSYLVRPTGGQAEMTSRALRYDDELERRGDGWVIVRRRLSIIWTKVEPVDV